MERAVFNNPVIFADYSAPDVICVGDTYYMTCSSRHFVPALPLLVSNDLVNWNLVGYAVKSVDSFSSPNHFCSLSAPSLRYHDNRFVICVALADEGIFVTESADFYGEWSPLRLVKKARGFVDPCPFWDDSGKAYIVHSFDKLRIGFQNRLSAFEVDSKTLECIGEERVIFSGEEAGEEQFSLSCPKIFKRGAFFYILVSSKSELEGWQTLLRSFSLFGPYSESVVLEQNKSHVNSPCCSTLVSNPSGLSYLLHTQDRGTWGNVVFTEPASWTKGGWLSAGSGFSYLSIPGEALDSAECPSAISEKALSGISARSCDDDFSDGKPSLQWQWQANPSDDFVEKRTGERGLFLKAKNGRRFLWEMANVLSEKIVFEDFFAEIEMDISGLRAGEGAGAIVLSSGYMAIEARKSEKGASLCLLESYNTGFFDEKRGERTVAVLPLSVDTRDIVFVLDFTALAVDKKKAIAQGFDTERPSEALCVLSARIGDKSFLFDSAPFFCRAEHSSPCRIGFYARGSGGNAVVKSVRVKEILRNYSK